MNKQYRQGDVFFQQIDKLPSKVIENSKHNLVLVYGESTGHGHRLSKGKVYLAEDGAMFLKLSSNAQITHEEHKTIDLPKGYWAVIRQREYTPEAIRTVVD